MHNWEYKKLTIMGVTIYPQIDLEKEFNALGLEGWELCGILAPNSSAPICIFKRPLYDEKSWDRAMDGMLDLFDDEGDEDEA